MNVKLLTEHHLEFLSLKGGCTGSSQSAHVKMPHCLKSRRGSKGNAKTCKISVFSEIEKSSKRSAHKNHPNLLPPLSDITVISLKGC